MLAVVNVVSSKHQGPIVDKISRKVQTAMINYSELQDKGRFFSGVDFMHFTHEVLPHVVQSAIEDYIEEVETK